MSSWIIRDSNRIEQDGCCLWWVGTILVFESNAPSPSTRFRIVINVIKLPHKPLCNASVQKSERWPKPLIIPPVQRLSAIEEPPRISSTNSCCFGNPKQLVMNFIWISIECKSPPTVSRLPLPRPGDCYSVVSFDWTSSCLTRNPFEGA